jgi:hypothetical protein
LKRLALDGDALGLGDLLSELLGRGQQRSAIIPLPQDRTDAAQNRSRVGIGDDRLETVPNLDSILVIFDGEKNQQTFVGSLLADSPLFEQADGDILHRFVVKRIHCDDGELRTSGALHVAAIGLDLGCGPRIDDVSEIVHVTGRLEFRRVEPGGEGERAEENRQPRHPAESLHRK